MSNLDYYLVESPLKKCESCEDYFEASTTEILEIKDEGIFLCRECAAQEFIFSCPFCDSPIKARESLDEMILDDGVGIACPECGELTSWEDFLLLRNVDPERRIAREKRERELVSAGETEIASWRIATEEIPLREKEVFY